MSNTQALRYALEPGLIESIKKIAEKHDSSAENSTGVYYMLAEKIKRSAKAMKDSRDGFYAGIFLAAVGTAGLAKSSFLHSFIFITALGVTLSLLSAINLQKVTSCFQKAINEVGELHN